jgi:predicted nucleotidyltransferase
MSLDEIKKILRDYKYVLQDKYDVGTLGIFGSYVWNEHPLGTDLDVLVDFANPINIEKHLQISYRQANFE